MSVENAAGLAMTFLLVGYLVVALLWVFRLDLLQGDFAGLLKDQAVTDSHHDATLNNGPRRTPRPWTQLHLAEVAIEQLIDAVRCSP
ncbi:MAG: hypothetical protein ACYCV4_04560 [Dermatophilaceae bacterium]